MDLQAKRQLIEQIDDEVKELHPLLFEVLSKLPRVGYVEYTHGQAEMGADFVVERVDEGIGTTTYVGIVAKADKILQAFGDVERQIDECAVPRLIRGGKESVRLPEVWVITSKTISQNAKQKIHDKFNDRVVHFFDSAWLTEMVDKHAPFFWEQLKSSVGVYLSALDKKISQADSQSSLAPATSVSRVYIDLDIEETKSERYTKSGGTSKPRLVNFTDEVLGNKATYLEASMGFGKSHVARQLASHLASPGTFKQTNQMPILASFKAFLDSASHDADAFVQQAVGQGCYADCLADGGLFVLILDGIDEATADDDKCQACLESLISTVRSHSHIRLVLTSRPLKLLEHLEAFKTTARQYRIRPISISKILNYLREILVQDAIPNKLMESLSKSHLFKQLPQNPIAASLLANLISQKSFELPSNLTELYAKTVELMLGRWDERRSISTEKQFKATERLARHLARHMMDNQLVYMARTEVREMLSQFLAERNLGVLLDEAFDYLVYRSNLMGTYEDTDVVFFRHRSFAEFLYAKNSYELRDLPIDGRAFQPYWSNIYFFYLGTLLECPAAIETLAGVVPKSETERWLQLFNMGNYMLAGYQTPYGVIEKTLDVVLVEAAKLFVDVKSGRYPSKLTELSEMSLLWFMAQTIKQFYGYEFFEKALPSVICTIDDSLIVDEETKLYAIFFAACALGEADNNSGYEFLLSHKKTKDLPVILSLGLRCEMEYAGKNFANSAAVKQHTKRLNKLLFTDTIGARAQEAKLEMLFKQPLSTKLGKTSVKALAAPIGKQ